MCPYSEAAELLHKILDQESEANEVLTQLAEEINSRAAESSEVEDEETEVPARRNKPAAKLAAAHRR